MGVLLLSLGRFLEAIKCFEYVIVFEDEDKTLIKKEWTAPAIFCCMIACIREFNKIVMEHFENKIPYSQTDEEFSNKTNSFEESCHGLLIEHKIIPQFSNETEFVDFCMQNYHSILDKLEPSMIFEFSDNP